MRFLPLGAFVVAVTAAAAPPPVLNVGHRGASGYAPEHTLVAYDLALSLGADYVEQDLQLTSDGVLVCLHDATLDRTARGPVENCTGLVSGKTLAQIQSCDVGSWFNDANPGLARPEYVGLRIPTLREVFERYGRRVSYYIETKAPESADQMEERLLALLDGFRLRKAARRWRVLIQSFSPASLQKIHGLDPKLPRIELVVGFGPSPALEQSLDGIAAYAIGVGPSWFLANPALMAAAKARCLEVHPYTVNQPADMATLIAAGTTGMFTNVPDQLDGVLGTAASRAKKAVRRARKAHRKCRPTAGPDA
jgi:glycerophosphoryl diester phosphodiesterase